jgi:hypothetical protein
MSLSLKFAIEAEVQQNHAKTTAHYGAVNNCRIVDDFRRAASYNAAVYSLATAAVASRVRAASSLRRRSARIAMMRA